MGYESGCSQVCPIRGEDIEPMSEGNRKKVLVIEDNELNMKLFCDLLTAFGFEPVQSRDGVKALELAHDHKPALIIMDINLPSVSGLDLTRWIKDDEELATIPVMAVTAFAMRSDEDRVKEAGCEAYMSKPIQMMPFLTRVQELTAREAVR